MSKSNAFEEAFLRLIFNATTFTGMAINATASPVTNLHVSLHTADPGEAGTQSTNETTYTSYARVAVARTTGGWTVTNNQVKPVANVSFPQATGGTATITHFGVGTLISGAGVLLYSGTVTPNIAVSSGITPVLTTDSVITED